MERVKRRWWTVSVTVLASLVVFAAVLSGLFQLAILALPGYREQLSDYVSRVANRPIDIGGVALVWYRLRPQLELDDIVIYADDGASPALSAERLRIGFSPMRLIHGDTFPNRVELAGLQLAVQIDADDHVSVRGLDTAGPSQASQDWRRDIARFDTIQLENCTISVSDAKLTGGTPKFRLLQARARRRIGGASFDASIELPTFMGESAEFEGRIDGDPDDPQSWKGNWTVALLNIARLPWLEARLPGHPRVQFEKANLSVSGDITQGRIESAQLQFDASSVAAFRGGKQAKLSAIDLNASARRDGPGWALEMPHLNMTGVSGPWPATRLRVQWLPLSGSPSGSEIQLDADFLRLQDMAPWLMLGDDPANERLTGVFGELHGLVARARLEGGPVTYSVRAQLDGLGLAAVDERPGFSGLSGEISATEAGGRLSVLAQPFELQAAQVFSEKLAFDQLEGALDWTRDEKGWEIAMPAFSWALAGTRGQGDLQLLLPAEPGTSPHIKLAARFSAQDVTRLKPYLPVNWSQSLHDWLDRAIVAGRVSQGRLAIEGELAKFPFADGDGVFQLDLDVADARLAYAPDWPAAEQVAARLQFRANGLNIIGDSGKLAGNRIEHLVASIPDFKDSVLNIDGEVDGEASRYYDFLQASPLAKRLSGLLTRTQASGNASVAIKLTIPLRDVNHALVNGVARLKGVDLLYSGVDEPFRGLSGEVDFNGDSASAQRVEGTFYSVPVAAALTPIGQGNLRLTAEVENHLQADGNGLSRYVPAFLRAYLSGSSHVNAEVVIGPASNGLLITSDLRGVTVDLPVPVGKPADASVPLSIRVGGASPDVNKGPAVPGSSAPAMLSSSTATVTEPIPTSAQPLLVTVAYGERLGVGILLMPGPGGQSTQRVRVHVGSAEIPLPVDTGVNVEGSAPELDVGDWVSALHRGALSADQSDAAVTNGASGSAILQTIDLHVDQLHFQGYTVGGAQLAYRPATDGGWTVALAGDNAEGLLNWQVRSGPHLVARLSRLNVKPRPASGATTPTADSPPPAKVTEPLDPRRGPTLDLDVENLRLGEANLGHVRINTERIDAGQRLVTLSASGADLQLSGSGEWVRRDDASTAQLSFDLDAKNLGDLLEGFGYARNVTADRAHFVGNVTWPLALSGVDLALAQGRIDLDMDRGSFSTVEPGAGRVLGLLNIFALPRRLTLNFSDVVSKGLGFDHVKGHFDAAAGNARTDDLRIEAPSVKIDVRGRIGLTARDYDQRITVYPGISGGVTLGALLIGGPALGAIALVAQEVLNKPLDSITQLAYSVTGTWDNPQVKRAD